MRLNTIQPGVGSNRPRTRVGRGIGSGLGKTCGRGHKGQSSRSGGYHKMGFEGGQMPLQRRIPKSGFVSAKSLTRDEIRLHELTHFEGDVVSIETLQKAGLITRNITEVKIILAGEVTKKFTIAKDIRLTKGARTAIEKVGGKVEE